MHRLSEANRNFRKCQAIEFLSPFNNEFDEILNRMGYVP